MFPISQPAAYNPGMKLDFPFVLSRIIVGIVETFADLRMTRIAVSTSKPPLLKVMPERTGTAVKGGFIIGKWCLSLSGYS